MYEGNLNPFASILDTSVVSFTWLPELPVVPSRKLMPPGVAFPVDSPPLTGKPADDGSSPPRSGNAPERVEGSRRAERCRGKQVLSGLAAAGLAALGFAGAELVRHPSAAPRAPQHPTLRPATPREWLHDFSTYSSSRPALICSRLFSPAFAAVYKQDTGTSCGHYLGHSRVTPLKLRHILQDGSTAVIELRTNSRADWTIVLARQAGGWRQIDFIAGTPAR